MASRAGTIYFWRETEPAGGFLSQWFYSPFRDADSPHPDRVYTTAEHYMMYHKAVLFGDEQTAAEILATETPRAVKALGRKVRNFDDDTWVANRDRIVRQANVCKFTCAVSGDGPSAASLKDRLLATGDQELVEASPFDRIWGIGFAAKNAPQNRHRWGQNRLGKALMEVRAQLQDDREPRRESDDAVAA